MYGIVKTLKQQRYYLIISKFRWSFITITMSNDHYFHYVHLWCIDTIIQIGLKTDLKVTSEIEQKKR